MDTHTHTHTHTHTPGAVETNTHTHTHLEQWRHTHTHTHTWSSGHTHTHTHTHTWSSGHTHTHTHTWSSGHTHTHLEQWTHTHLEKWTHTHTHLEKWTHTHTHLEQWGADTVAPREQLGVRCLAQVSHLSRGQFLPEQRFEPTTSGYNSNATRPRLPHNSSASLLRSGGIITADSKFTSGYQWLSLILAILEPHIKKKTTNFCELSVQGSSALCCEMKRLNLTIGILDFGVRLYGGSELSKHLSKCLLRMQKIERHPNFFCRTKISETVCKRDWHNVRMYLFFNVRTFRMKICAMTFTPKISCLSECYLLFLCNYLYNLLAISEWKLSTPKLCSVHQF